MKEELETWAATESPRSLIVTSNRHRSLFNSRFSQHKMLVSF